MIMGREKNKQDLSGKLPLVTTSPSLPYQQQNPSHPPMQTQPPSFSLFFSPSISLCLAYCLSSVV